MEWVKLLNKLLKKYETILSVEELIFIIKI